MKPIVNSGQDCKWFVEVNTSESKLQKAVSCAEALGDLPAIVDHLGVKGLPRGVRRLDAMVTYSSPSNVSAYAKAMREWPGFSTGNAVNAHVIRSLPRDFETFKRMEPGDQYPEAYEVAVQIYEEKLAKRAGKIASRISRNSTELWDSIVPPYDPSKFPNKWWKLDPSCPSKTLTAHIGKDTYSHIHYDSQQARTISVREAARLQSFPDGFQFAGAMNAAFRQIGNAVPPLIAFAIARQLRQQLKKSLQLAHIRG